MIKKERKGRKLAHEILGIVALCFVIALLLYLFLFFFGVSMVENYCWQREILLSEEQIYHLDNAVFSISLVVSVGVFVLLFLILFGERLAYIRTIIEGVRTLQQGKLGECIPLEGNNELTRLAEAVNYLSLSQQEIKAKETRLQEEKETLIRTLSHDIRTPLTSILSYSELLAAKEEIPPEEGMEYCRLVQQKATRIKELTDILLDGGRRSPEHFSDARLLWIQLVEEWKESLEDRHTVQADLSGILPFEGSFDVQELRRVFDNLSSNIQKYASPAHPVELWVTGGEEGLTLRQRNAVASVTFPTESYQMGIQSIRRIAQHYAGHVEVREDGDTFEIQITLLHF